jgi:hypothetical protein
MVEHGPAAASVGGGRVPVRVIHATRGLAWRVEEVLDGWKHPGGPQACAGEPEVTAWYLLRVWGPLPGRPAERGRFVIQVQGYGDRPGWWLTLASLPAPRET